jgi:hypothetical protein
MTINSLTAKIILILSVTAISILLQWNSVYAEATQSGPFSVALNPGTSIVLYTDFTGKEREVMLTVCVAPASTVVAQISADGTVVLAVAASTCRTVFLKAHTFAMSVEAAGTLTGNYSVSVDMTEK